MKKDLFARSLIVLGAVFLFFLISFFVFKSKAYNSRVSDSNVVQLFEINKNEGVKTVGLNLSEAGLIKNKYYFYYQLWERGLSGKIQAGSYELRPNMNVKEIVDKIIKGEIKEAYQKLTIPEGFTNAKIVERMKKIDSGLAEEFGQIVGCKYPVESDFSCLKLKEKYEFLKDIPSGVDLEGYLFPDTYFIYPEDDAFKMVTKFLNNFQSKVDEQVLSGLEDQDKDLHQILTLASIVEKEVRSAEDMKKVAGIFWKRVEDDYLLQSCATLAYILGEDKKQYSYEDTQVESPFNTYTHKGLPPGPVSNPGLSAIEASVDPEKNDYYYFLSDPQTNQTIFSKTLEEHNLNKHKYGL